MINKENLYIKVKHNIDRYLNLEILNQKVRCPFAINIVEREFISLMSQSGIDKEKIEKVHSLYSNNKSKYGWYRGKGTPEQIEKAFLSICKLQNFNVTNSSPEGIRATMKNYGLGIDCSGFIYNILLPAFEDLDMKDSFIKSLEWGDKDKTGASRASVDVFSGRASTVISDLNFLNNLDLVLMKNKEGSYIHMGMILKNRSNLQIVQSTLTVLPNGVRIDRIVLEDNKPKFKIKRVIGEDWNTLYENGQIEFRRLKILEEIN
jgi:hypothetical protein